MGVVRAVFSNNWNFESEVLLSLTEFMASISPFFPFAYSSADPMEEDILQVVKYCTDLIEEKDLEKLDLVMKYMKR